MKWTNTKQGRQANDNVQDARDRHLKRILLQDFSGTRRKVTNISLKPTAPEGLLATDRSPIYRAANRPSELTTALVVNFAIQSMLALIVVMGVMGIPSTTWAQNPADAQQVEFFERRIRPILTANCNECHSADKHKGGLNMDTAEGMFAGGELGVVVVPGKPTESLLIKAIHYEDAALQMPPKGKLRDRDIELLTQWVAMGAPWPGADVEALAKAREENTHAAGITDEDRAFWAFQPITKPALPNINTSNTLSEQSNPSDHPIDRFITARLNEANLSPAAHAAPRELIRRVYFDLIGLPPTAQEIADFEADPSEQAYKAMIDHLLAKPQYGERWARHWLDVVRYAQTNGYERDNEKPYAWRYRDYVIKAFNEDKPYDQFVIEQLAGDELPDRTADSIVATGYYRLGVWDDEPDDARMAEFDALDDIAHVTGSAFMGLTIGCARCHVHKFDPISHEDYYEFVAFFRNVRQYENPSESLGSSVLEPMIDRAEAEVWQADKDANVASLKERLENLRSPVREQLAAAKRTELSPELLAAHKTPEKERNDEQKKLAAEAAKLLRVDDKVVYEALNEAQRAKNDELTKALKETSDKRPPWEWALAITERGTQAPPTHVLIRGNAATPGDEVQPEFLDVLGGGAPNIPPRSESHRSTGLRLALAQWIASPDNPLTARVMVNRIWQHHFGTALAVTPNDFGRAGVPPTHPKLLDYLAWQFIENGWSIKAMHRLILTSHVYRQSSRIVDEQAVARDPGNTLYWRQNMRRLEAEAVRDSVLAVSGQLNLEMHGPAFFPKLAGEVVAGASKPGFGWGHSSLEDRNRRSIYTFVKRTMLVPLLETFDYTGTESPMGRRATTTVSPQALLMLNSRFMRDQAAALAHRIIKEGVQGRTSQIKRAFVLALGREPTPGEIQTLLAFLDRQENAYSAMTGELVFRPDAAEALHDHYLNTMPPEDLLEGPRVGWNYAKGVWGGGYSGIKELDESRGPFALWNKHTFSDGQIDTHIAMSSNARFAGILLRASEEKGIQRGYEIRLDSVNDELSLLRHGEKAVTTLAKAELGKIPSNDWRILQINARGPRIRVTVDDVNKPVIDFEDPDPIVQPGDVGVRVRGGPTTFKHLIVTSDAQRFAVAANSLDNDRATKGDTAKRRALEALCLLVFNLNEFVYVD